MITHVAFDITSVFSNEQNLPLQTESLQDGLLIAVFIAYLPVLSKTALMKRK